MIAIVTLVSCLPLAFFLTIWFIAMKLTKKPEKADELEQHLNETSDSDSDVENKDAGK